MKTMWIGVWMLAGALGYAAAAENEPVVDSVTVQQGTLVATVAGKLTEVTNEITFPKGIQVLTNGAFTVKGGRERLLRENQILTRDGMLTSPDGSIIPVHDHLMAKRGQVYVVKDGVSTPLTSTYTLKNGVRVSPDGKMVTPRNLIQRLLDGQIVKLDDSSIEATDTAQLEKGKVVLYKDGGRIELRPNQTMAMADGSKVSGSGFVVYKDGRRVALREGELIKFAGAE